MIVRDEANMIDACLASARGLVSEMIVVDTGSKDDTRERARRAGAKVFDIPWRDDFSHARNASLARATGDWVLVLDADERLVETSFTHLRKILATATFDCAMVRIHDAVTLASTEAEVLSGKERMGDAHWVPRLVRRTRDIEYVGVIHENLGPWLTRRGSKIVAADLDIVHYGATRQLYVDRAKFERNVRLLQELAKNSPEDPTPLGYLAAQYLENNDLAEAHRTAEEGWRRMRHVEVATGYRPSILRLADVRALVQLWTGDLRGVLETVQRAERYEGAHYDLDHLAGYALELLAVGARDRTARARYLHGARAAFERCLASAEVIHWHAFVVGASGWSAWTRLGSVDLLLGDFEAARRELREALRLSPGAAEARLGLLEATLALDGPRAALAMVAELMADAALRESPDLWVLAASACEELGAIDDMARFIQQARAQKPTYVGRSRRTSHAQKVAALALYRGAPIAGPGLVGAIGALAARDAVDPADVGAWPSDAKTVLTLVANLARTGKLTLLEPLLEPRADVVVPGLTEHVRRAAESLGLDLVYEPPPSRIVVRGADAPFVAELLAAHPRLAGHVAANDASSPARVVDAGEGAFTRRGLLDDPVKQCDRLLAALGEGDAEPLIRHLVETYSSAAAS
jgi:glycosyltransferase involved in cell wall biosynthesis